MARGVAGVASELGYEVVLIDGPQPHIGLLGRDEGLLLAPGAYRIGKSRACALRLHDGAVSHQHVELVARDGGPVVVRDLGSTNGCWFAGARFSELEVDRAATIVVGKTTIRIEPIDAALAIPPSPRARLGGLVGGSEAMRRAYAVIERVAASAASVLIEGETGTGKELAARAIHDGSPRRAGPFVVCDLGNLAGNLSDSELFGHVRGAFTGADRDRVGAFVAADGGTIFLDEIGELPLEVQPRLLRALESREVRPLGATAYRPIDVRVVAATNRDLAAEVQAGRFREDLYHRLGVVVVRLPPLRERLEDLPMLVAHLRGGAAADAPTAATPTSATPTGAAPTAEAPTAEAIAALAAHDWPGNVRELRNVLERAAALGLALSPALLGDGREPRAPRPDDDLPFRDAKTQLVDAWERDYVRALLARCHGNVSLAARRAGMDRAYLHRLLKKHGLAAP